MAYNGSGTFVRLRNWQADATAGVKIRADYHDNEDDGFAAGLTNAITRDGQSPPSANLPMNGKQLTNLGAPVNPTDAATKQYVDAIKNFSTGIILDGSTSNGMVSFTGATPPTGLSWNPPDISFVAKGSVGAGQWVWNDKADATGTDCMILSEIGSGASTLTLKNVNDTASGSPLLVLDRASPTPAAADVLGMIRFNGRNSASADKTYGEIYSYLGSPTSGSEASNMYFRVLKAGAAVDPLLVHGDGVNVTGNVYASGAITTVSAVNGARITASEYLVSGASGVCGNGSYLICAPAIGNVAGTVYLRPNGVTNGAGQFMVDNSGGVTTASHLNVAGNIQAGIATFGGAGFKCRTGYSGGYDGFHFNWHWNGSMNGYVDSTHLGYITFTSDYRIKKDVEDLPSTWETVKALHPIKYTQAEFSPPSHLELQQDALQKDADDITAVEINPEPLFLADDIERWGFIAHELQETLVPSAASGTKDMADGVQAPNWLPVVAALTKALQEAMARIEVLEAKP